MIQIRRGTPAEWESSNEILAAGQPAVSWDGNSNTQPVLKIGNGQDVFSALPQVSGGGSSGGDVKVLNEAGTEVTMYTGTTLPADSLGKDGDFYCFYTTN